MYGNCHKLAEQLGLTGVGKIGLLSNDTENKAGVKGVIIREINLGPKNYFYEYICEDGSLYLNNNGKMKCKGIKSDTLHCGLYDNETSEKIIPFNLFDKNESLEFMSFKKRHLKIENANKDKFEHFSVQKTTIKREFNKTCWCGANLIDNKFYPVGYQF
jgi:hypothetical protein